jgi:hypothetical protein
MRRNEAKAKKKFKKKKIFSKAKDGVFFRKKTKRQKMKIKKNENGKKRK